VLSKEVQKAAEAAGLSWRTVRRAKQRLGVEADLVGYGKAGRWYWQLSKMATPEGATSEMATREQGAISERDGEKPPAFAGPAPEMATSPRVALSVAEQRSKPASLFPSSDFVFDADPFGKNN